MSEKTKSSLSPWPFLIIYTLPICVMTGYWRGGLWHFQTLLIVFGLVPLIDWMLGLRTDNPSPEEEDELVERRAFRWITWLVVPVQVAVVFTARTSREAARSARRGLSAR
ncbi:MAG: hypothetical protein M5R36_09385 [Deltaproteobacteria bacterium]|nr:hypothetical protein [Deltaproteobacteria bacterium]